MLKKATILAITFMSALFIAVILEAINMVESMTYKITGFVMGTIVIFALFISFYIQFKFWTDEDFRGTEEDAERWLNNPETIEYNKKVSDSDKCYNDKLKEFCR